MSGGVTGRARGPYQKGIRRRREIVESAANVFGRYGYAGGSLRQIADEVGVTPAALTRHFDSKEGLLVAVLAHWDAENDRVLPERAHGLERIKQTVTSVSHHINDRGLIEMFLTVATEASNPSHPANEFIRYRYERVIGNAIEEVKLARERGEILPMTDEQIETEVRGVYALMDGIQLQWLLNPTIDLVGVFKTCLGHTLSRWTGREVDWDTIAVAEPGASANIPAAAALAASSDPHPVA